MSDEQPLDHVVLPETHSPMYLMHKFWARKPANLVRYYINKYSQPGEIILDPFMGSGVTVLEAVFNNRKAIGVDINPISAFICRNSGKAVDLSLFSEAFKWIETQKSHENSPYSRLYHIKCPKCQKTAEFTHLIWNNSQRLVENPQKSNSPASYDLIEIRISCTNCGTFTLNNQNIEFSKISSLIISNNEEISKELMKEQNSILNFHFRYPNNSPFLQLRHSLRNNNAVTELFSPRSLIFLTWLRKKILDLPPKYEQVRELMLFTFSSALSQASRMVWVIDKRRGKTVKKKQVGSWTHHFFWNPHQFFEINAWNCYKARYQKVLKGKQEANLRNKNCKIPFKSAPSLSHFFDSNHYSVYLLTQSITKCLIPENSVDFIFTDPPYGDSIQYGELAALWANFLGYDMEKYLLSISTDEIVINSKQNKNMMDYHYLLKEAFAVIFRVLKPGKFMVLTFHNNSTKIRNSLVLSILENGFSLKQILFQLPARASLKSMLHHKGSPIGDYILRFQKPEQNDISYYSIYQKKLAETSYNDQKEMIKKGIIEILQQRGEPTNFIWINNLIDEFLYRKYLFPLPNFDKCISDLQNDPDFSLNAQEQWWLTSKQHLSHANSPLTIRIKDYLQKIINSGVKSPSKKEVKQFFFNKIYEKFKGVLTPDKYSINQIIQEMIA